MTSPEDQREFSSAGSVEQETDKGEGDLDATLTWLRDVSELGAILSRLAIAELRLAVGDMGRCLVLALLALPLLLLAWIGLCVLVSWFAYSLSGYPGAGFAAFFLLQVVPLLVIKWLLSKYSRSFGLPETRYQLKRLFEDAGYGKKKSGS